MVQKIVPKIVSEKMKKLCVCVLEVTHIGEHTIHYTDEVIWNCTPEIYIVLLTNVTSINSIKKEKN